MPQACPSNSAISRPGDAERVFSTTVMAAGVVFVAALLLQVIAAWCSMFGLAGSVVLVVTGLGLAVVSAVSLAAAWLRNSPEETGLGADRRISGGGVACVVFAVAAAIFAARWVNPSENILGGNDEGIYAITAANLAHTGRYRLHAALLPGLPADMIPLVTRKMPRMANRTEVPPPRYPAYHVCLFVEDAAQGTLVSQFPVGFPALLGSAHAIFGFAGQRLVNPLLLLIGACIAGGLVTSWAGRVAGAGAFVLWLWFPLQAWAGNSRYAEVLLQLLWLLTLRGVAGREKRPTLAGALAGLALGVALAVKIDALPVAALTAVVLVVIGCRDGKNFPRAFLIALAASAICSLTVLWRDNRAYAWDTLRSIWETNRRPLWSAGVFAALLAAVWWTGQLRGWWIGIGRGRRPVRHWLRIGLMGGFLAWALHAWLVRSDPAVPDAFYYWPQGGMIRSYREDTFARLAWYWRPWGLGVAVLGMLVAMRRANRPWQWLAIGIGAVFLISFSHDIRNNPMQPYALRRFTPYATPLMLMGASLAGGVLPEKWRRLRQCLTITTAGVLMFGFRPINERLNGKVEYPGLTGQAARLAEHIPDRAVVLVSDENSLVRLASGLEFYLGKPCLVVRIPPHRRQRAESDLRAAFEHWTGHRRRVFVLSPRPGTTMGITGVESSPLHQGVVRTQAIVASAKELVTRQSALVMPWCLNELRSTRAASPPPLSPASPPGPP